MSNSAITYFTKKQNEVESWIFEKGFRVRSEVDIDVYRADLCIDEIKMIVEIDGPNHRKIKDSSGVWINDTHPNPSKRDVILLRYYPNGIYHVPVDIEEDEFKQKFQEIIKELGEKGTRKDIK